ncbi:BgTH12-07320 [Blumeria graminis f. sp. triticale]|uniref:Leucine carboxyl methyltransferase 1 n=1 Tax=Blumeria graminis f. sp. triticale TaxID=1689686 RepID=A0A9W4GI73_BLUGR|nr:BgTH12-07320 [Blumeria graminis f. sp. triticale]
MQDRSTMPASQIPNLLSLRGKSRPHSHAKRRTGAGDASQNNDLDIQGTDTDAAVSRLSAVSLGYLTDQYASSFVKGPNIRRLPVINRGTGTYTRTTALDTLIEAFLSPHDTTLPKKRKQIISLGAGTDTRYFRLRDKNQHLELIYHEFDFPSVSRIKKQIVTTNSAFLQPSDCVYSPPVPFESENKSEENEWGILQGEGTLQQVLYYFHPLDLREMSKLPFTKVSGLCSDIPTLIISECCLCYMDISQSSRVIKWFMENIPSIGIILYEPLGSDDSFGKMMVKNLAARNIFMPSLTFYKSLSDQRERLSEFGFKDNCPKTGCKAETIENIWEEWVPFTEKERLQQLEGLDEVEEWQILARHYAISWGWKCDTDEWNWVNFRAIENKSQ